LTGTEGGKSNGAIGKLVRRITKALEKIRAPITISCGREALYIKDVVASKETQTMEQIGSVRRTVRGKETAVVPINRWAAH